jgi:hypothetical protein
VDLDSAEGLKRVSPGPLGHALYLDAAPLLASIDAEIESLRDPLNPVRIPSSFGSPARSSCCARCRQLFARPASGQSARRAQAGSSRSRPSIGLATS